MEMWITQQNSRTFAKGPECGETQNVVRHSLHTTVHTTNACPSKLKALYKKTRRGRGKINYIHFFQNLHIHINNTTHSHICRIFSLSLSLSLTPSPTPTPRNTYTHSGKEINLKAGSTKVKSSLLDVCATLTEGEVPLEFCLTKRSRQLFFGVSYKYISSGILPPPLMLSFSLCQHIMYDLSPEKQFRSILGPSCCLQMRSLEHIHKRMYADTHKQADRLFSTPICKGTLSGTRFYVVKASGMTASSLWVKDAELKNVTFGMIKCTPTPIPSSLV